MGWLARGIGDFGSQVGEGYLTAQDYKQKRLQMLMEQARAKQQEMLLPLQIQEIQERLKQMGLPKEVGLTSTPGGGTAGVTFDPTKSVYSLQNLVPGMDKNTVKQRIMEMAKTAPTPEYKSAIEQIAADVDFSQDPSKELAKAETTLEQAAGKKGATTKTWAPIRGVGGLFAGVKSPDGTEYFSEETIPDEQGKALFRSMKDTEARYLRHQQEMYLLAKAKEQGVDSGRLFNQFLAGEKMLQPIKRIEDVSSRAQGYVSNPTGPGDVALLSAFVEATKPANGFRWTQQEVNLIRGSRGWVEGAQARVQSGFTGILFGDDQRKIIGSIVTHAGVLAKQRKAELLNGMAKFSPPVADALQMTPGGELEGETEETPGPKDDPMGILH